MFKLLTMIGGKSLMPYVIIAAIVACPVLYLLGEYNGASRATDKLQAINAKLLQRHIVQRQMLEEQIGYLSSKLEEEKKKDRVIYKTIKEKVAVYEQANPDINTLCFDAISVQHINDYATGTVPDPASESDDLLRHDASFDRWPGLPGEKLHT